MESKALEKSNLSSSHVCLFLVQAVVISFTGMMLSEIDPALTKVIYNGSIRLSIFCKESNGQNFHDNFENSV